MCIVHRWCPVWGGRIGWLLTGRDAKHWLERWVPPAGILARLGGIGILVEQTVGHAYGLAPSWDLLGVALWFLAGKDGLEVVSALRGGGSRGSSSSGGSSSSSSGSSGG